MVSLTKAPSDYSIVVVVVFFSHSNKDDNDMVGNVSSIFCTTNGAFANITIIDPARFANLTRLEFDCASGGGSTNGDDDVDDRNLEADEVEVGDVEEALYRGKEL